MGGRLPWHLERRNLGYMGEFWQEAYVWSLKLIYGKNFGETANIVTVRLRN